MRHASGMTFALESARRGARYVQIGLAGKPVSLPFDLVCFKELTVTSGNASTSVSWRRALALVDSRAVALEALVSSAVPLERWDEAERHFAHAIELNRSIGAPTWEARARRDLEEMRRARGASPAT